MAAKGPRKIHILAEKKTMYLFAIKMCNLMKVEELGCSEKPKQTHAD